MDPDRPRAGLLPLPPARLGWPSLLVHALLVPAVLAAVALTLQYSDADMWIARFFYVDERAVFSGQESRLLELVGHKAALALPILVGLAALAGGIVGCFRAGLRPWRAILFTLAAAMIVGPVLINQLKPRTTQQCPIEVREFGGRESYEEDRVGPFWAATRADAGECLPSGHAAGGYALLALYFAGWAAGRARWRWTGLAIGIGAGLAFSLVRVMQGAHFTSATTWSAVVSWMVCSLLFLPLLCGLVSRHR